MNLSEEATMLIRMNLLYLGLSLIGDLAATVFHATNPLIRRPSTGDDAATTGRLRIVAWVGFA